MGWGRALVAVSMMVGLAGLPVTAYAETPVFHSWESGVVKIQGGAETNAWHDDSAWYKVYNQSASAAYAKIDDEHRGRLEAMAECHPGVSSNSAAARITYRFKSEYGGPVLIRPVGSVYGTLVTYGGLGSGEATAKVTFSLHDETTDTDEIGLTKLHDGTSPSIIKKLTTGDELEENSKGDGLGEYHTANLVAGHTYWATIKLWVDCYAKGFYTVRVDYSRHAPGMIGYVMVDRLEIAPMRVTESSSAPGTRRGGKHHGAVE